DQRSHRRGLATSGRPRQQYQSLSSFRQSRQYRRQVERLDGGNLSRQQAYARCECAALIVKVGSEPAHRSTNEAKIQRPPALKLIRLFLRRERQQKVAHLL